jgi:Secretion system C-terminal sorting domain
MLQLKKISTSCIALFLYLLSAAQAPCLPVSGFTNGSFESFTAGSSGCTFTTNSLGTFMVSPFNNNCVTGWFAPVGTPNLFSQVFGLFPASPAHGSVFAGMSVTAIGGCRQEVIAANVALDPNFTYELSFSYRATTQASVPGTPIDPFDAAVIITSGLGNTGSLGGDEPCVSIPGNKAFSITNFSSATWQSASVIFTPTVGQNQIAFVPTDNTFSGGASFWLIDNVVLKKCTPCKASFNTIYCGAPNPCVYTFYNTSTPSSGASITSYTWTVTALNDPEQPVFTSSAQHLVFAPTCNGLYKVCLRIRDSKGCEQEYCQNITVSCTSCRCQAGPNPCEAIPNPIDSVKRVVNEPVAVAPSKGDYFKAYPNPGTGTLRFDYQSLNSRTPGKLQLVTANGQEVYNSNLFFDSKQVRNLTIQDLKPGVYFLRVTQSNSTIYTDKIVVSK